MKLLLLAVLLFLNVQTCLSRTIAVPATGIPDVDKIKGEVRSLIEISRTVARKNPNGQSTLRFLIVPPSVAAREAVLESVRQAISYTLSGAVVQNYYLAATGITIVEVSTDSDILSEVIEGFLMRIYNSGVPCTIEADWSIEVNEDRLQTDSNFHLLEGSALTSLDCPVQPGPEIQALRGAGSRFQPNDRHWRSQWGLDHTLIPEAWHMVYRMHDSKADFKDKTKLVVIDSGVQRDHPDLIDNMWVNEAELNGVDGVDDDGNGYIDDFYGWDAIDGHGTPIDEHGHGTTVAGTIGASSNNFFGIAGINWKMDIIPCKFIGPDSTGTLSDAVRCIDYSVAVGGDISNISWGSPFYSAAMDSAIEAAGKVAGQAIVAAAGDEGKDCAWSPVFPASLSNRSVISVAAIDESGQIPPWSNYGSSTVHMAAPGNNIITTYPADSVAYDSSTSAACPHVAGMISLLKVANPTLSVEQIKRILKDSSTPMPGIKWGAMNAKKAIEQSYASLSERMVPSTNGEATIALPAATVNCRTHCRSVGKQCDEAQQLMIDTQLNYCRDSLEKVFGDIFGSAVSARMWNVPTGCSFSSSDEFRISLNTNHYGSEVVGCDGVPGTEPDSYKVCACRIDAAPI